MPELRFPEFIKDGEWIEKPLDEICKLVRGPFGDALKKDIVVAQIMNRLRSKNTIELLGLWEKLHNPDFKLVEFDQFKNEIRLPLAK